MADNVTFDIKGLDSVLAKMKNVSDDVKYKGGRFALRKAAQVVRDSARAKALLLDDPITAQNISKNIVERWSSKSFKRTGNLMFRVGVTGGARQYADTKENRRKHRAGDDYSNSGPLISKSGAPGGDTFYWRFIEFGTQKNRAKPFMRPAFEQNIGKATNEFVIQYGKALDRAIKKAGKV